MHELLILISLKSHALVAAVGLLAGGALGFIYGGSVEKRAQAALGLAGAAASKAASAISAEVRKL